MSDGQETIELEMLQDFYACWCNLHSIPRSHTHRKKMELAAQRLVDSAHAVAAYKKSLLPEKPRLEVVKPHPYLMEHGGDENSYG